MWAKADYLEFAFYPTSTQPVGKLFQCLRFYRQDQTPLERQTSPHSPVMYRTAHATEWTKLENVLVNVRRILVNQRQVDVLVGLDKIAIFGPSSERYSEWSPNRDEAKRRAYHARRKFLYLVALISFHIAAISQRTGDPNRWCDILSENGIAGHTVDSLASSIVGDFSPNTPRAGVFVDPSACSWTWYLPVLIAARVPLYFSWGSEGSALTCSPAFEKFLPTSSNIAAAVRLPEAPSQSSSRPPWRLSTHPSVSTRHPIIVDDSTSNSAEFRHHNVPLTGMGSVQLPKRSPFIWKGYNISFGDIGPSPPKFSLEMSPGEFFARRAMYREAYIREKESQQQKSARLDREKNATRYQVSQKGQDEVYEWDFDYNSMRWKRTRVARKERETVWEAYDPGCKRYDPVTREWDVAHFLEYGARRPSTLDEYDRLLAEDDDAFEQEGSAWDRRPLIPLFREQDYTLDPTSPDDGAAYGESFSIDAAVDTMLPPTPDVPITARATTTMLPPPAANENDRVFEDEWTPQVPDLLGLITCRHAYRFGETRMTATKRLTLEQACQTVGFLVSSDISDRFDNPARVDSFINWTSAIADMKSPPSESWLLHKSSATRMKETLRLSHLVISPLRDSRTGHPLFWAVKDKRPLNRRGIERQILAVQDPSTAIDLVSSASTFDEAVQFLVTYGMNSSGINS